MRLCGSGGGALQESVRAFCENKISYTYWELMTACGFRVFMNESYEDMKSEYIIPRSTMTSHLRKICHAL